MSYFKDVNSRNFFELAPGANAQTFWGDKMLMSIVTIDPNSTVPNHTHPHEQAGMLIEGSLNMTIGNESKLLLPGDIYIIPGEIEHYAKSSDIGAKVLDIFSPVREEFKY
jgi:quercetin dioxygenase-like cupin family protein